MDTKDHWERVYLTRNIEEVSWHQRRPSISLDLIRRERTARTFAPDTGR